MIYGQWLSFNLAIAVKRYQNNSGVTNIASVELITIEETRGKRSSWQLNIKHRISLHVVLAFDHRVI